MQFATPLVRATLMRRYKRFLADVRLEDGAESVAHCANSGSMMGCAEPGATVWLSPNTSKTAKLDWRWELVEAEGTLVGINTSRPNAIVEEAIKADAIDELTGYKTLRREVKYGQNSRIDLLLEDPGLCYVEVKNVTLKVGNEARFPDAKTARGLKHLQELGQMVAHGHRAVMVYLVNRNDCQYFAPVSDIDPAYAEGFKTALEAGVEAIALACDVSPQAIKPVHTLPIIGIKA